MVMVLGPFAAAQDLDVLIRNGRIVDGAGNPSFHADLGVKAGKIAAIGRLTNKTAAREINASGLVVAPGFIDMHNHSDESILGDGNAESMVRQGVTSMILGEGSSAAPTPRWLSARPAPPVRDQAHKPWAGTSNDAQPGSHANLCNLRYHFTNRAGEPPTKTNSSPAR